MSNASCIAWRIPWPGLRAWSMLPQDQPLLRFTCRDLRISSSRPLGPCSRSLPSRNPLSVNSSYVTAARSLPPFFFPFRSFRTTSSQNAHPVEHGVRLRDQDFSAVEINKIFKGSKISPAMGNRTLAVLQGRRIAGTLDLEFPIDVTRSVGPVQLDYALQWLRENYPLDEDASIIARIEKEEREEEAKLIRRAEELGLYKPQSGTYDAERGENDDVSGKSILKKARKQNEERMKLKESRRKKEEERKVQEWMQGEVQDRAKLQRQIQSNKALQKFQDTAMTEARPRADPRQNPVLAWYQKHHLQGTNMDVNLSSMTTPRRLLPTLLVAILTIGGCYTYAVDYKPPERKDRMFPDIPPAGATIMALIGLNLGVYLLWKFPPAWKLLNRYFISVPLYPYPLSMIGSVFSHQLLKHFAINSAILWFIGTRIHDDIGRGNFLSVYLASGVFGSFASLTAHVLGGNLTTTSLGASGAICGIVATYCLLHSNDRFTLIFLPTEWRETISIRGWGFLAASMGIELLNLVSPWKFAKIDHWAHLGGYAAGVVSGLALKWELEKQIQRRKTRLDKLVEDIGKRWGGN